MPPKKGKKGKKEEESKEVLPEVDKAFFELEIADLNRKLERIKNTNEELEARNRELEAEYKKLDEDRADVIAYLKRTLQTKIDEVAELQERVKGIEEKRQEETSAFLQQIKDMKKEFNVMREQLTSEIKMISGKLNSLEEFRMQRDTLMAKFENQEKAYEDQETHYKKVLHETEKKFIISKDNLKKELESRLLTLAQDFQDATEIRIASSTHRVIRENIAVNNELKEVLSLQANLSDQNTMLKEKERSARLAIQLAEEQRDTAMEKSIMQTNLIERLTKEHTAMKDKMTLIKKNEFDFESQKRTIEKLSERLTKMDLKVHILQQNLHVNLTEKSELKMVAQNAKAESEKLLDIVSSASLAVKGAIKLCDCPLDDSPAERDAARRNLLKRLLDLLSVPEIYERTSSLSTIPSTAAIYRRGDLGFVPKETAASKSSICSSYQSSIIKVDSALSRAASKPELYRGESLKTIYSRMIVPAIDSQELIKGHLGEGDGEEEVEIEAAISEIVEEPITSQDIDESSHSEYEGGSEGEEISMGDSKSSVRGPVIQDDEVSHKTAKSGDKSETADEAPETKLEE